MDKKKLKELYHDALYEHFLDEGLSEFEAEWRTDRELEKRRPLF